jgi:hypothetical protein
MGRVPSLKSLQRITYKIQLSDDEHATVERAAAARNLSSEMFVRKLLLQEFSIRETHEIVLEIGADLFEHIFACALSERARLRAAKAKRT